MIYGIGVDIVNIDRIKKTYAKFQDQFVSKILTQEEIKVFNKIKAQNIENNNLLRKKNLYNSNNSLLNLKLFQNQNNLENQNTIQTENDLLVNFLAKKFAIKEASVKALGSGFSKDCAFFDIWSSHDNKGKPILHFNNKIIERFFKNQKVNLQLSISDDKQYIVAFVIIEVF